MKILLGVTGGIAAYKAAELVRRFQQEGWSVQVAMTRHAQEFVGSMTFAALTGEKVLTDLFAGDTAGPGGGSWDFESSIEHIAAAQSATAMVVAPVTAHTLARFAHGLADDFLTTLYLATPAPVVIAPAMNVEMWRHPATRQNLELLRQRGHVIVEPQEGYLACGMVGAGRLAELDAIVEATRRVLEPPFPQDLAGETVLITAGPTREPIDAVRYLSNRSSGRMGYALAEAAARRGARVLLISGPVALPAPQLPTAGFPDGAIETISVGTAEEMAEAALQVWPGSTIGILAAAVADYRVAQAAAGKIKKTAAAMLLELTPTRDVLAELGGRKGPRTLVGFAAETAGGETALGFARDKLQRKNADLIVLNDVSRGDIGFEAGENEVTLVSAAGEHRLERAPKTRIAHQILDEILAMRSARTVRI